jgi:hypothetical protein
MVVVVPLRGAMLVHETFSGQESRMIQNPGADKTTGEGCSKTSGIETGEIAKVPTFPTPGACLTLALEQVTVQYECVGLLCFGPRDKPLSMSQ